MTHGESRGFRDIYRENDLLSTQIPQKGNACDWWGNERNEILPPHQMWLFRGAEADLILKQCDISVSFKPLFLKTGCSKGKSAFVVIGRRRRSFKHAIQMRMRALLTGLREMPLSPLYKMSPRFWGKKLCKPNGNWEIQKFNGGFEDFINA